VFALRHRQLMEPTKLTCRDFLFVCIGQEELKLEFVIVRADVV